MPRTLGPDRYIRTEIINAYDIGAICYEYTKGGAAEKLWTLGLLLQYNNQIPTRRKRKRMNVDKMIERWVPVVAGLATAHDKDALDDYESQIDSLLMPLLSAPVAQLREFAPRLLARLKADPRVPFLVWRGFEVWIEGMIIPAQDEGIIKLKTDMAERIARMVEPQIQGDLVQALIGALQWRSEETLSEIEAALKAGGKAEAKPKIRGRQSCLFLRVRKSPRSKKFAEVML